MTSVKTLISIYDRLSKELDNSDPLEVCFLEHQWRASREFWDKSPEMVVIGEEFYVEYQQLITLLREIWGNPSFEIKGKEPFWYWYCVIEMACWEKTDKAAFICLHREDCELPYEIKLGMVLKEAMT